MPEISARHAAFAALVRWQHEGGHADAIVADVFGQQRVTISDRNFAVELFYGVLRNLTLLDFWVRCLRTANIENDVRAILRIGLYQLLILAVPEHAAVYETVELGQTRQRALVNGILRTAIRERDDLQNRARGQPLSIRKSHPEFIVSRWQRNFGSDAASKLCQWNNEPPPIYGRVNELKIDLEQFRHRYPMGEPSPLDSRFFRFVTPPTDALARGHCYVQDLSTTLACRLLDPQPAEQILDACAAPGGKTIYLAQMMQNRGVIVASDRDAARLAVLQENVARLGATIVKEIQQDWMDRKISGQIQSSAPFDRVLIDVPCTNTGVMRRRLDLRWRLQPEDCHRMQKRQLDMVASVLRLLKPGGTFVYSTCSLEPEENEEVVAHSLAVFPQLRLIEQQACLPHRDGCDGAFAAKFALA